LRKLRREAAGFLTVRDKEIAEEFVKNMRSYLQHIEIFEMVKGMYDKRQKEQRRAEIDNNGLFDLNKVTLAHMEEAGVSLREFEHIKLIYSADPELFRPSEYGQFSPHSMIIDVAKY
jgi:hypothetical protein